jgi:hypothetical protein
MLIKRGRIIFLSIVVSLYVKIEEIDEMQSEIVLVNDVGNNAYDSDH